jgi:carboxylesterase
LRGPAYWRAGSGSEVLKGCWTDDPARCKRLNPEFVVALGDTPPDFPPSGWRGYYRTTEVSPEELPDRWTPLEPFSPEHPSGDAVLTTLEEGPFLERFQELRRHDPVFLDARNTAGDELRALQTMPVRAWLQSEDAPEPSYYEPSFFPRGASGRDPLFVFLHGYTGSPENWDYLVKELDDRAFFAPLLPGHGLPPSDFARYGADEWAGVAEYWSRRLTREHGTNVAVGLSMGGALSVVHWEHYDALVLINTPLRVPDWRRMFFPMYEWIKTYHEFEEAEKVIPVSSLRDLQEVLRRGRDRLEEVEIPVLVINHGEDETVSPNHGRVLANRLPDAEHRLIEEGVHESPTDPDVAHTLREVIVDWLEERNILDRGVNPSR